MSVSVEQLTSERLKVSVIMHEAELGFLLLLAIAILFGYVIFKDDP